MECFKINGGKELNGTLTVGAAKNAILPLIAASILTSENITLKNCAQLSDVIKMLKIVESLGGKCDFSGDDIYINCKNLLPNLVDCQLTGEIRSSFFILGPILSRFRHARICYPGGCEIGLRPIDLHIDGLRQLNVKIVEENGVLCCDGSQMKSGDVYLDFPSVGATENLIMASVLLPGRTVIRNAAREPEITDMARFLNSIGAKIYGAGSDTVYVDGVRTLCGGEYSPLADRITAGTFIAACALSGGDVFLKNCPSRYMHATLRKIRWSGCKVVQYNDGVRVLSRGRLKSVKKIETQPYPGFPTDMQPQMAAMMSVADGTGMIVENLFENRFKYTQQLQKMGADITVIDRVAIIKGVSRLRGATVLAQDLRGGAALVIAALNAEGESVVCDVRHIDRGYYAIERDLASIGADIVRITR